MSLQEGEAVPGKAIFYAGGIADVGWLVINTIPQQDRGRLGACKRYLTS
jgi:hypothetical protein